MYVRQPAGPSKNYWISATVGFSDTTTLLSEGAGSMLPGLAIILHLKFKIRQKCLHNY